MKKSKNKQGYYLDEIKLLKHDDKPDYDKYKARIYVEELDKYTNGTSKIKLLSIEVYEGVSIQNYNHIKNSLTARFLTIVDTSSVEWLTSENEIKQERKDKLESINKVGFFKKIFKW